MLHTHYYVIRPSENFVKKLATYDQEGLAGLLQEPSLWSRDGSHRRPSNYLVEAKLLYLAFLRAEYSKSPEFGEILGDLEISEKQFDMWWKIEQFRIAQSFNEIEKWLPISILDQFVETENTDVDRWISKLKENARQRTR